MNDDEFLEMKLKLDKMTLDLMLALKQMKELNNQAFSLQKTLQDKYDETNQED